MTGRPDQIFLKVVAEEHVDLVVMGVQGKGVVNRLVFGSTTHRVRPGEASPPF